MALLIRRRILLSIDIDKISPSVQTTTHPPPPPNTITSATTMGIKSSQVTGHEYIVCPSLAQKFLSMGLDEIINRNPISIFDHPVD